MTSPPSITGYEKLLDEIASGKRTLAYVPPTMEVASLLVQDKDALIALCRWSLQAREALEEIRQTYDPYTDNSGMFMEEKAKKALSSFPTLP